MKRKATPQELRRVADAAFKKLTSSNPNWWQGTTIGKETNPPKPVASPAPKPDLTDNQPILVGASFELPKDGQPEPAPKQEPLKDDQAKRSMPEPKLDRQAAQAQPMDRYSKSINDAIKFDQTAPRQTAVNISNQQAQIRDQLKLEKQMKAKGVELKPKQQQTPKKQSQKKDSQQQRQRQARPQAQPQNQQGRPSIGPTPFGLLNKMTPHPMGDEIEVDDAWQNGADLEVATAEDLNDAEEALNEAMITVAEKQAGMTIMLIMGMRMVEALLDRTESY